MRTNGSVQCWGAYTAPTSASNVKSLCVSNFFACVHLTDSTVICLGKTGYDNPRLSGKYERLACSRDDTVCGYNGSTVTCFGSATQYVPKDVEFTELVIGLSTACGLSNGKLLCYGQGLSSTAPTIRAGSLAPIGSRRISIEVSACPNSTFSATQGASSELCSGLCAAGYYGGGNSELCTAQCTPGHYCPVGTSLPIVRFELSLLFLFHFSQFCCTR